MKAVEATRESMHHLWSEPSNIGNLCNLEGVEKNEAFEFWKIKHETYPFELGLPKAFKSTATDLFVSHQEFDQKWGRRSHVLSLRWAKVHAKVIVCFARRWLKISIGNPLQSWRDCPTNNNDILRKNCLNINKSVSLILPWRLLNKV